MHRKFRSVRLVAAVVTALSAAQSQAAPSAVGLDHGAARVERAAAGSLTAASNASPRSIVAGYLQSQGRGADVIASLQVAGTSVSPKGVTHVRVEQRIDGLGVYGAYAKAAINGRGELVQLIDRLVDVALVQPSRIDAAQALDAAAARLYPGQGQTFRAAATTGTVTSFAGGAAFYRNPTVTAVVLPLENRTLARGWLVETWTAKTNQLHHTVVDGEGRVLEVVSRTNTDSYNVFVEDPLKAGQTVVSGPTAIAQPYGTAPSPLGWLGTATQTTINLSGNNVRAYLDTDANNAPDAGGTTVTDGNFLTPVDLAQQPSTAGNKAVAAQNLFYLNNRLHDALYAYGFDEANGNFQVNNFGRGGAGNDPVNAEAQDGSGTDNANFSTPSDGSSPRMQMYVWNSNPSGQVSVNNAKYALYPSAFGAALTATGVSGPLAATANPATAPTDADGCNTLPAGSLTGKVAIIARGTCNFTTKVLNAQNAGAKAVIITNNDANGAFGPGGSDRKVKIPSGMVSKADGDVLRTQIASTALMQKITALQLDGDIDADIVMHEYGHGLTWRMIGSMSGPLAGAIGEGASDVVAFLMNCGGTGTLPSATCDDVVGEYAYNNPLGIRRYRYDGYPLRYSDVTGAEVHNDGEIYAAAMWNVLKNYAGLGLTPDDLLHDFVDGMNWTPAAPAFEDMRDGMLQSVGGTSARGCAIWKGFAAQGIGVGASGTVSRRGTVTITASYSVPAACQP